VFGGGDGGAVVGRGIVLGDDHVFHLDDDAAFARTDEDALAGVVRRQGVAASGVADEAVEARLTGNEFGDGAGRDAAQRGEIFLGEKIDGPLLGGGVDALVGVVLEPVQGLGVEVGQAVEVAAIEDAVCESETAELRGSNAEFL